MKLLVNTLDEQMTIIVENGTDIEQTFVGLCLEKCDYVNINGWECEIEVLS